MSLKNELVELLKQDGYVTRSFFNADPGDYSHLETAGITWTLKDHHGGEGEGEYYYSVYEFTKSGESEFIKFEGSYYSYAGTEFDSWFFVTPKSKTITVYE